MGARYDEEPPARVRGPEGAEEVQSEGLDLTEHRRCEGARARQAAPRSNLSILSLRTSHPKGGESRRPRRSRARRFEASKARLKAEPLPHPPAMPDLWEGMPTSLVGFPVPATTNPTYERPEGTRVPTPAPKARASVPINEDEAESRAVTMT